MLNLFKIVIEGVGREKNSSYTETVHVLVSHMKIDRQLKTMKSNLIMLLIYQCHLKIHFYFVDAMDFENEENCMETEEQFLLQPDETSKKYVYVNTRVDYQYRSASLHNVCLYDYMRFYRKKPIDEKDRKYLETQSAAKNTESKDPGRGRPFSERENFQAGHPQASSHINIKRMKPVVPVLLGPPVPRRDREDTRERYCRSILTLFFPWRSIQDLCDVDQTWEQAFEIRHAKITSESCKIIDNVQLLQECKNDRDEHLQQVIEAVQTETVDNSLYANRNDSDSDDDNTEILDVLETIDMSEIAALKEPGSKAEHIYFEKVVQAVDQANRFANIQGKNYLIYKRFFSFMLNIGSSMGSTKSLIYAKKRDKQIIFDRKHLVPVTIKLVQLNNKWQRQIKDEKERRRNACMIAGIESNFTEQNDTDENQLIVAIDAGIVSNFDGDDRFLNFMCTRPVTKITVPSETTRKDIVQRFRLNKNQKAAFMIITGHLDGLDKINDGKMVEWKTNDFSIYYFCR